MGRFKFSVILLFFFSIIISEICIVKLFDYEEKILKTYAYDLTKKIEISYENQKEKIFVDLIKDASVYKISELKKEGVKKLVSKLKKLGFSNEEIVSYIMPEVKNYYEEFNKKYSKKEIDDEIIVKKNKCEMKILKGKNGVYLDKNLFYKQIVDSLLKNKEKIKINLEKNIYKNKNIETTDFIKKSEFATKFVTSSNERKNNIKKALASFDGVLLNEGEILSFNKTTGERTKDSGYMPAKIISGGTFISDYGGGVCQVSTTIYNACLLAGLEIREVHNHSLPVSYVEPGFDAMVNQGSSDLIIKNNTNGKILITTSSENDVCKVVLFGKENNFRIERMFKKTKMIPAQKDLIIETDYRKYGIEYLNDGEEKQVSEAKDGFCADGYLNYFDKQGNLIKTKKIRESIYNPTKAVVVRKEN